jgi:hypothetical protein
MFPPASKYLSVKLTAVLASRAAPTLLCPGTITEGFSSLTFVSVSSHFALALLFRLRGVDVNVIEQNVASNEDSLSGNPKHGVLVGVALDIFDDLYS